MLFGTPDKFAFLIERVPEWESSSFINGIMYVYLNGKMYPDTLRTTTLNVDLHYLFNSTMPDFKPKVNADLYRLSTSDLFEKLCEITFPDDYNIDNDYSYQIPLNEIQDSGYYFFAVAFENKIRILVGKRQDEDIIFQDETALTISEFENIRSKLFEYYKTLSGNDCFEKSVYINGIETMLVKKGLEDNFLKSSEIRKYFTEDVITMLSYVPEVCDKYNLYFGILCVQTSYKVWYTAVLCMIADSEFHHVFYKENWLCRECGCNNGRVLMPFFESDPIFINYIKSAKIPNSFNKMPCRNCGKFLQNHIILLE